MWQEFVDSRKRGKAKEGAIWICWYPILKEPVKDIGSYPRNSGKPLKGLNQD